MRIYFHGTNNKKIANKILKTGFKVGTYYAKHLEDALCYGGKYVFEVAIDFDKTPLDWQIIASNVISPNRIVSFRKYSTETYKKNDNLRNQVFVNKFKRA